MNKFKKALTLLTLTIFIFGHVLSTPVFAAPEAPAAPSAPSAPTAPEAPSAPSTPSEPGSEPSSTPAPSASPESSSAQASSEPSSTPNPTSEPSSSSSPSSSPEQSASSSQPSPTPLPSGNQTGAQDSSGNNGGTTVSTGDATNTAGLLTTGNSNLAQTPGASAGFSDTSSSAGVVNDGNGSGSNNNASLSVSSTNTNNQDNSAQVTNNLDQSTITGQNSANDNTGGNVDVKTGDANVTGTIVNSLNTNVSGVSVAEFNVEDDHIGDIVLDFASGCISNCGTGSVQAANTGNGADSTNVSDVNIDQTNETFQNNDANVGNNLTLVADSGNNEANANTNGDVNIQTGDANVAANVLTFANNNVAGDVIYTVVNVFGDLVGDIIMPKEYIEAAGGCSTCGGGDVLAANTGNGANSNNELNVDQTTTNNTYQYNDANIENNLIIDATTAGNSASGNTAGDNEIKTGDTNVNAQVLNVANSNVAGGVWWLVLVNEAGNWVGKIVGSPDGSNLAGSEGTEFIVTESGEVIAVNSGNGAGSDNTANIAQTNTNNTTQNNTIDLVNNVNLAANTGKNQANDNTGSNSKIETGDANVVANIVNFVNNNITGGGKLFVTVVNVFGSWKGNFITPDGEKEQLASSSNPNSPPEEIAQGSQNQEETVEEEEDQGSAAAGTTTKKKKVSKAVTPVQQENLDPSTGAAGASIGSSVSQVAGVKIGPKLELPDGALVGRNKIKVNLAWLILVLPLLGLIALSRLRIAYYTRQIRNKLAAKRVEGVLLGSLIAVCIYLLNRVS